MKNVAAMYGTVFSVLLMVFLNACGSVSEGSNSSAGDSATKTQIELAAIPPTSIAVGEKKTATIAVDSEGTFQGFQFGLRI